MLREDLENAVAVAKFAFIQGGRRPLGRDGRQAKAVLPQRTSLHAQPYDCCRVAANAPALCRTASCRAAQRWRIGARADPDVPLFFFGTASASPQRLGTAAPQANTGRSHHKQRCWSRPARCRLSPWGGVRLGRPCIPAVMKGRGKHHCDRHPLVAKLRAETSAVELPASRATKATVTRWSLGIGAHRERTLLSETPGGSGGGFDVRLDNDGVQSSKVSPRT